MSGHSKWSQIRYKKAAVDARRGKLFSKVIREITVAARLGGGDPDANPRLRTAIQTARAVNMPQENIQRAIQKGTGELEGAAYEEVVYEGYGPGGVAILLTALTDNKNRTVAELRHIFSRYGGNLGEVGCVAWMFNKKGLIVVEKDQIEEEDLMLLALEAGAEDIKAEGDTYEILTAVEDFEQVKQALQEHQLEISVAEISMIPQATVKLEGKQAQQMLKLMEALEDHDDVQHVYANFDIPEEVMSEATL
ncbi:MAG: YebC/PmpR family DNA-binding transcriptional regulator [Nitrospinota bacterium]|nr:MAG: YebC/PmpR family DNA-binding transcriptional regulator [Nitrospinota bacterium]